MKLRYSLFIFLFVTGIAKNACSQRDLIFWFAAPDISSDFSYDRPIMLRITSYNQPATVTISQPAGGGMPVQTISLAANTTQSVNITTWLSSIECAPANTTLNYGLKISSTTYISAYYEVNVNGPNPEIFALKGENALGTQFYISSQYLLSNSSAYTPRPYSSFNIVATEDNTNITITPTQNIVGHAANVAFNITLNKGQVYAAVATSQAAAAHLQGSSVSANKPIAVTLSDDLLSGAEYGGACADMAGDQTIPVNKTGTEYIAFKSNLNSPSDKLYITATQNGTTVTQDGTFVTTLNAGQSAQLTISNPVTYVQTSFPAYAYHLAGYGCEVGSAILPKINCTGSSSVSVARSTAEPFIVTLLVKNGGQGGFLVNGSAAVITAGNFNVVPGTAGVWYYAKATLSPVTYPNGSVITISNTLSLFQEGVLQGDVSGVSFGYFSDYNTIQANATTSTPSVCVNGTIQLNAEAIPSATYSWVGPGGFNSNSQNVTIANATIAHSGTYTLTLTVPGCGTSTDIVDILVNPPKFTTVDHSICEGQTYLGYTTSGTYVNVFTSAAGCDSTRTLNLTVKPKSLSNISAIICEGENYAGHTTTGTYTDTYIAANGCDSIRTLNLTVKPKSFSNISVSICEGGSYAGHTTSGTYTDTYLAANGCDSVRTLNLTVKPKSFSNITIAICEGENYSGYTTPGTYTDTYVAANGCDSLRTLNLTVKPKSFSNISASICDGESYAGHTTSGTYIDTYIAANGCDSTRTLNLTVKPKSFSTISATICEGESYAGHTTSGNYTDTYIAANGCDSVRTLNLTVKPKSFSTISISICQGENYAGYTTSGTYSDTYPAANGCDSIRTLNLTVKPKSFSNISISICAGESYEGYTTAGTFTDTYIAANGCDSTRTLNLTVKPKSFSNINASICEGESYAGHTTAGTYTDIYTAANGCDSTRTLNLTIKPKSFSNIFASICEGQNYDGHTTSGTYTDIYAAANGCDSTRTLNLTVTPSKRTAVNAAICQGQTYFAGGSNQTTQGVYQDILMAVSGCDSIITTTLTVHAKPLPDLGPDKNICAGKTLTLNPGTFTAYQWQDMSGSPVYTVTTPGVYWVTVTDGNNCSNTDTLHINKLVLPPADFLKPRDSICQYETLTLYPLTSYATYQWSTGSTQQTITVSSPGQYYLTVQDKDNCIGSDTILVIQKICPSEIFIPSAFTPNNDQRNDQFKAIVHGSLAYFRLEVYNRNGELVFSTTDAQKGWNGNFKGLPQDSAVFAWQCFYQFNGYKAGYRKGTITLIR